MSAGLVGPVCDRDIKRPSKDGAEETVGHGQLLARNLKSRGTSEQRRVHHISKYKRFLVKYT
jgi:hypothetical protein